MNDNMHNFVWSKIKYGVSSLLLVWCILWVQSAEAGLQQVFRDGSTGRFSEARTELQRLSKKLEIESTTGDISTVGRNSAALGFYFMLSQAASDCESGRLSTQSGEKLFEAGENAGSGDLKKAAALTEEVTTTNPDYPIGFLILGRVLMGQCMQHSINCTEAVSALEKSISLDKTLDISFLDLGMLYQHIGKREEAIKAWNAVISEDKAVTSSKWAHLMLAMLYVDDKQWQLAQEHAEKAKDMGLQASNTVLSEIKKNVPKNTSAEFEPEGISDKTVSPDTGNQPESCIIKKAKEEQIEKMMNEISDNGLSGLISNLFNLISSIVSWILFSIFCLLGI